LRPSPEHLACLNLERQGKCHNKTANVSNTDKSIKVRSANIARGRVMNSPGILEANDPWVWESDIEEYKVLSFSQMSDPETVQMITGRKYYLLGDSLTRQWAHSMRCELQHVFGLSAHEAEETVKYYKSETSFPSKKKLENFLKDSSPNDYFVFNYGHHLDPTKKMESSSTKWEDAFKKVMKEASKASYKNIPLEHVFYRTTSVRHFLRDKGDWYTNSSVAGGAAPNMNVTWSMYGGNHPSQPEQNLIALDVLGKKSGTTATKRNNIGILDTSPMMLARGDASFDGSHFCLPGPIDYWSRMLYYRIYREKQK